MYANVSWKISRLRIPFKDHPQQKADLIQQLKAELMRLDGCVMMTKAHAIVDNGEHHSSLHFTIVLRRSACEGGS